MRYFIYLAYDGTNYHGWQIQPNAVTVGHLSDADDPEYVKSIASYGCYIGLDRMYGEDMLLDEPDKNNGGYNG